MISTLANRLLARAGLAPRRSVDRLSSRLEKVAVALEQAQEQLAISTPVGVQAPAVDTSLEQTLQARFEARLATQAERHAQDVAALQIALTSDVQSIAVTHDAQIAAINEQSAQRVANLKTQHTEQVTALKAHDTERVANLKAQHAEHVVALKAGHGTYIEGLKAQHSQNVREVAQAYQQRLERCQQLIRGGRQELMLLEVKLDILEGAVNMLDQRLRAADEAAANGSRPALAAAGSAAPGPRALTAPQRVGHAAEDVRG